MTSRRRERGGPSIVSDQPAATAVAVFVPSGRRGAVRTGTTVLDAARELGVDLDSVCGGRGICGRCQVEPAFGAFAKHAITSSPDHLSPCRRRRSGTTTVAGRWSRARGWAARPSILGDVVIDVPAESQVHRPVVRKAVDLTGLVVDPVVRLHYVEVDPAALGEGRSDLRLLLDALAAQWSLDGLAVDPGVLVDLQPALAAGGHAVTVAVHGGHDLIAVWPGFVDVAYGVAVDVGSTTIAGHLCELGIRRGAGDRRGDEPADPLRRGPDEPRLVRDDEPGGAGPADRRAVQSAVDELVGQLDGGGGRRARRRARRGRGRQPDHAPPPARHRPDAARDRAVHARHRPGRRRPGRWTSASRCRRARLHVLPCIAGHVGADAAAAILAEGPHRSDEVQLLVDVGTNAEIVLGQREWLLAASSPTGPAFEGAQISCGQRATPGAIERVRIDRDTLEPRITVIGGDRWSDEPGFAEHLPPAGITGVCGSGIIEVVAELFLAGVIDADGTIDGALAARTPRVVAGRPHLRVRAARAERRSTRAAHHPERRARHPAGQGRAAGRRAAADGPRRAGVAGRRRLGPARRRVRQPHRPALRARARPDPRLPARPGALGRQRRGLGAVRALLSPRPGPRSPTSPARSIKIETAIEPRFQAHFVAALAFPHATDPYANLSQVVLPERRVAADAARAADAEAAPDRPTTRRDA